MDVGNVVMCAACRTEEVVEAATYVSANNSPSPLVVV